MDVLSYVVCEVDGGLALPCDSEERVIAAVDISCRRIPCTGSQVPGERTTMGSVAGEIGIPEGEFPAVVTRRGSRNVAQ